MPDADVQRAAEFLAAHAVLLLGLGLLAAVATLTAVVGALRLMRRYRVPSGYLTLLLILGLAATAAVAAFVVIAEAIIGGGELVAFDRAFATALRESSTPAWERVFAAVSWLGQREALAIAAAAVALRLWLVDGALIAAGWIAAQAGGGVLNLVLKQAFARTRPDIADPLLAASSWSFPSAHAMGTFILCGLGCYVLLRDTRSWTVATLVVTASLAWCIVMAFSRLYLGVHFASDVIAGLVAGAAWVAVCACALEMVRRQHVRARPTATVR